MLAQSWRFAATATALVGIALLPASPAAAATIGSALTGPADAGACPLTGKGQRVCTLAQSTLSIGRRAADGLVARRAGTVTRWRVRTGIPTPGTTQVALRLRILDGTEGGRRTPYFDLPLGSPGVYGFPANLPILPGQRLGLDVVVTGLSGAAVPILSVGEGTLLEWIPELGPGSSRPPESESADRELLLQAEVRTDQRPPRTHLTYRPRQDFLDSRKIVVFLRSNEDARAIANGQIEIPGRPNVIWGIHNAQRRVERGEKAKLVLRVPREARDAVARAFANGKVVIGKVSVYAVDAAGNESGTTVAAIKPKR